MTNGSNERQTVASLDKRVTRTEDKIIAHERECTLRYESLEAGITSIKHLVSERFGEIMDVLGSTEDKGLRGKVADLRSVRDKGKGAWFAIAAGAGIVATVGGWLISLLT